MEHYRIPLFSISSRASRLYHQAYFGSVIPAPSFNTHHVGGPLSATLLTSYQTYMTFGGVLTYGGTQNSLQEVSNPYPASGTISTGSLGSANGKSFTSSTSCTRLRKLYAFPLTSGISALGTWTASGTLSLWSNTLGETYNAAFYASNSDDSASPTSGYNHNDNLLGTVAPTGTTAGPFTIANTIIAPRVGNHLCLLNGTDTDFSGGGSLTASSATHALYSGALTSVQVDYGF